MQGYLASLDPDYVRQVRDRAEKLGIYVEVTLRLPGPDSAEFEQTLKPRRKQARAACDRYS